VVDDGTLDGRIASAAYDDEGVPHRRNVVVEQGVLKSFLYDLKTAAQSGAESTATPGAGCSARLTAADQFSHSTRFDPIKK